MASLSGKWGLGSYLAACFSPNHTYIYTFIIQSDQNLPKEVGKPKACPSKTGTNALNEVSLTFTARTHQIAAEPISEIQKYPDLLFVLVNGTSLFSFPFSVCVFLPF